MDQTACGGADRLLSAGFGGGAALGEGTGTPIPEGERPAFVQRLLDVARGELGYAEGAQNYTKYGEWAGDPYAEWCAEFICWCVDQAQQSLGEDLLNSDLSQLIPARTQAGTGLSSGAVSSTARRLPGLGRAVAPGRGP